MKEEKEGKEGRREGVQTFFFSPLCLLVPSSCSSLILHYHSSCFSFLFNYFPLLLNSSIPVFSLCVGKEQEKRKVCCYFLFILLLISYTQVQCWDLNNFYQYCGIIPISFLFPPSPLIFSSFSSLHFSLL